MPITVPVTNTTITVAGFGAPVANAINGTAWTPLVLTSPWADFGGGYAPAAVRRLNDCFVQMRGVIRRPSGPGAGNESIFTIPVGFRPAFTLILGTLANGAPTAGTNGLVRLNVTTIGQANVEQVPTANTWIVLDNLLYPTN